MKNFEIIKKRRLKANDAGLIITSDSKHTARRNSSLILKDGTRLVFDKNLGSGRSNLARLFVNPNDKNQVLVNSMPVRLEDSRLVCENMDIDSNRIEVEKRRVKFFNARYGAGSAILHIDQGASRLRSISTLILGVGADEFASKRIEVYNQSSNNETLGAVILDLIHIFLAIAVEIMALHKGLVTDNHHKWVHGDINLGNFRILKAKPNSIAGEFVAFSLDGEFAALVGEPAICTAEDCWYFPPEKIAHNPLFRKHLIAHPNQDVYSFGAVMSEFFNSIKANLKDRIIRGYETGSRLKDLVDKLDQFLSFASTMTHPLPESRPSMDEIIPELRRFRESIRDDVQLPLKASSRVAAKNLTRRGVFTQRDAKLCPPPTPSNSPVYG